MKHQPPLEFDRFYHIFNRGINGETIFREQGNYEHFLRLYAEYVSSVAETFAWVLMKNHFHALVRVFAKNEIDYIKPKAGNESVFYEQKKQYNPTQQLGNLFNAYAKAYNLRYHRTGSLFESPFRRIPVNEESYLKYLVFYIHKNPVHHGFCDSLKEYPWSSYMTIISDKPTKLSRNKVLGWFNSKKEFIEFHEGKYIEGDIEHLIME